MAWTDEQNHWSLCSVLRVFLLLLRLFQHGTATATAITKSAAREPDTSPQTNFWLTEGLSSGSRISVVVRASVKSTVVLLGTLLGVLVIFV